MKAFILLALVLASVSCATTTPQPTVAGRTPSSSNDLSGDYLGEGVFPKRTGKDVKRPAIRLYLDRATDNSGAYHGVLVEYQHLLRIAPGYIVANRLPKVSAKTDFYLNSISTRISAYKFVPGEQPGTFEMHGLKVQDGDIAADAGYKMVLHLKPENADTDHPLADAYITGNPEGQIHFPLPSPPDSLKDAVHVSQFELAAFIYKKGHLASTWRGNWVDLEGSYLSEYGRLKDGVLELYSENGQKKMRFIKSGVKAAYTNPKSAKIVGHYLVSEPIPKMYVLTPTARMSPESDKEMSKRIGLFLDVFDASAPEAGNQMVTELAFTNSSGDKDAEKDFMMYYEHPEHAKSVGVEQAR